MKKKIVKTLFTICIMTALLAGCTSKDAGEEKNPAEITASEDEAGGDEAAKEADEGMAGEVNATDLGDELKNNIEYKDDLSQIDIDTAGMFISLDGIGIAESNIYESSGATAEEIVVLKCETTEDADKAEEALKQRTEEQIEAFIDYVPEELIKLENAVLVKNNEFVVLSVSDDPDKAKEIINSNFK
ncbi:MAG: DUF4358 domain-containing protein [Lachnospiraceae bacterium]|nr:DUF4358 domain-containing protein [Lachnospiraceae bacterium]